MVFRGKPSDACSECRARKMGCDRARPQCGQCIRGRRQCPGYKDKLDTMFYNETEKVVQKGVAREEARRKLREQRPNESGGPSSVSSPESQMELRRSVSGSPRILAFNVQDMAISFFFNNYGYVKRAAGLSIGYLSFLGRIQSQDSAWGPLNMAIQAVGLAGLGIINQDERARKEALSCYGTALTKTNELLQDPKTATLDTTLSSIIMLGMFEYVTCSTPSAMRSWTKHLYGASALLDMRGKRQFDDKLGIFMFLHMRSQIIMNCFQRHVAVPSEVVRWGQYITKLGFFKNWPANDVVNTFVDFAQLRADVKSEKLTDPIDILDRLVLIDRAFQDWRDNLPPDWLFTEHTLDHEVPEVLGLKYHTYTDTWIGSIWNNYRLGHLMVHEMTIHYLTSFSHITTPLGLIQNPKLQFQTSRAKLLSTLTEMSAGIPFHLGFAQPSDPNAPAAVPYAQAGLSCIWPLCIIGGVESSPPFVQNWAIGRLLFIGKTMGIQPALALATILRARQQIRELAARYPESSGEYMAGWVEIGRFSVFSGKAEMLFEEGRRGEGDEGSWNWLSEKDVEMLKKGRVKIDYL